jgi:hypothetical protein
VRERGGKLAWKMLRAGARVYVIGGKELARIEQSGGKGQLLEVAD